MQTPKWCSCKGPTASFTHVPSKLHHTGLKSGYGFESASLLDGLGPSVNFRKSKKFTDAAVQATQKGVNDVQTPLRQETRGNCYGCGAPLQITSSERPGFVEPERYELKRKHRQLNQLICWRCQQLSNGAMIPAVQGSWSLRVSQGASRPALISPEKLKEELQGIRDSRAIVILLVDLLDSSGSFVSKIREISGKNQVVLIGTKADLLPKHTDLQEVEEWLQAMALARKVNVIHTCTVSSKTSESIPQTAAFIRRNRLGRDVYIVGAANVGKSAFCRALMREMSNSLSRQYDAMAASSSNRLPVESAMPGTTLKLIPLRAFQTGGQLIDTPGLHLPHRLPHLLTPEEAGQLHPRGRLRPFVAPCLGDSAPRPSEEGSGELSATYFWGCLVKIQLVSRLESATLTFYGPPVLRVHSHSPQEIDSDDPAEESQQSNFGEGSVSAAGGFHAALQTVVTANTEDSIADIAISGVPGWITLSASQRGKIIIRVWTPRGVQAYLRPPLPCPNPAIDI